MTVFYPFLCLDPHSDRPVYRQLSDQLVRAIHDGLLRPGVRLLGTRKLAGQLGINRKTAILAYEDVSDQGYLRARSGSGYYVIEFAPRPQVSAELATADGKQPANFTFSPAPSVLTWSHPPHWLRLNEGAPDIDLVDLQPIYAEVRRLLGRRSGRGLLRYGDGQGDIRLREALTDYLAVSRGIRTDPERLLITRGSQQAFQLASRVLFGEGGLLAAAKRSYPPVIRVAREYGAEIVRVPIDGEGMDVSWLAAHPAIDRLRAVYVTPHHQYPTTVTLSAARRLQLLELARRHRFAILEDDYDYDFYFDRPPQLPLAALDSGAHVLYLGSFTKVLAPNLRIGYLHGPPEFVGAAHRHRLLHDRQGDLLLERALARYIREGDLDRHLRKVRPVYHRRRDRLVDLLHRTLGERVSFRVPDGGMALWLRFLHEEDHVRLTREAAGMEISLSPAHQWWTDARAMRVGFANLDEGGAARVQRLLEKLG